MRIETIDPIGEQSWEEFLLHAPQATVFHSSAWAKVLYDTYRFPPRYMVARDGDGRIVAGVPLFQVSGGRFVGVPFSDLCPPLLPDSVEGAALLGAAKRAVEADGATALELRGQPDLDLESHGFGKGVTFLEHIIPLDADVPELEARFRSSVRNQIRKARSHGLTVRVATTREDMKRFYVLNIRTRKKHGLIPQPWRFFENIHRHAICEGSGHLLLCEHKGEAIAGDLLLSFKDTMVSKFNASDPRFLHLRPNNLLLQSDIELGVSMGCTSLHLGRCEQDNEGLRRFKLAWGSREAPLSYYYYPPNRTGGWTTGGAPLARRLLALFVRFAPLWALRQAGAALYKRAA